MNPMKPIDVLHKAERSRRLLSGRPVVENFGDRQIKNLEDYAGDVWSYSVKDRAMIISIVDNFRAWCHNYTGKE